MDELLKPWSGNMNARFDELTADLQQVTRENLMPWRHVGKLSFDLLSYDGQQSAQSRHDLPVHSSQKKPKPYSSTSTTISSEPAAHRQRHVSNAVKTPAPSM